MEYKDNNISGFMDKRDLEWLFNTATNMKTIVEVGSWLGRSTHALLSGCSGIVYAIDHFVGSRDIEDSTNWLAKGRNIYNEFMDNVGSFENLKVIKKSSLEAVKDFDDGSIDMVFIDGGHSYEEVKDDIIAWLPKCKKMLCGHDLPYESVQSALKDTIGDIETSSKRKTIWIKNL